MWLSSVSPLILNNMEKHRVTNVNVKGFMADFAQAHFNVMIFIFGLKNPKVLMNSKECTFPLDYNTILVCKESHEARIPTYLLVIVP